MRKLYLSRDPYSLLIFLVLTGLSLLALLGIVKIFLSREPPPLISGLPPDAVQMVPELISHMTWKTGETVLDYGCGRGIVGYHLIFPTVNAHHGHQYGVEYQQTNVEQAVQNYSHPDIHYAVGNLLGSPSEFPFKDLKFDKIFAIYVFHLVPDLEALLGRFHEIMKPGAQLGFTTLTENNLAFKLSLALSQTPSWRYYMRNYNKKYHPKWSRPMSRVGVEKAEQEMTKLFEKAGFRVKHLKMGHVSYKSASVDDLLDSLFWLTPSYEEVPIARVPELRAAMRRQFAEITGLAEDARNYYLDNEYFLGVVEKI